MSEVLNYNRHINILIFILFLMLCSNISKVSLNMSTFDPGVLYIHPMITFSFI